MKKLSLIHFALLAILLTVVNSLASTHKSTTTFHVSGYHSVLPCKTNPDDWGDYLPDIPNGIEAAENPTTSEPAPFAEEQDLNDFGDPCDTDPSRLCLISYKKQDGVAVQVLMVRCGRFKGW
jgi:hypothetical protein